MTKEKKIFVVCLIFFLIQAHLAHSMERHENTSLIPAGEFLMGTEEGTEIERPIHKVYLEAFRISLSEVSNRKMHAYHLKQSGKKPQEDLPDIVIHSGKFQISLRVILKIALNLGQKLLSHFNLMDMVYII